MVLLLELLCVLLRRVLREHTQCIHSNQPNAYLCHSLRLGASYQLVYYTSCVLEYIIISSGNFECIGIVHAARTLVRGPRASIDGKPLRVRKAKRIAREDYAQC